MTQPQKAPGRGLPVWVWLLVLVAVAIPAYVIVIPLVEAFWEGFLQGLTQ